MRRATLVTGVLVLALFVSATGWRVHAEEEQPAERTAAESEALTEATALNAQVVKLWKAGRYREAEPLARKVLRLREEVLGPEDPAVAQSLLNLGAQLRGLGRYEEARPLYERSARIYEATLGAGHPQLAVALDGLAQLLKAMALYDEAGPLFERAIRIREAALGPAHPHLARSLNNLALLYMARGRVQEARPLFERSLAISSGALGLEHPGVAKIMGNLAVALYSLGLYDEAGQLYERALSTQSRVLGSDHPDVANTMSNLANLMRTLGRYDRSRTLYQRSLAIREARFGSDHLLVASSLHLLGTLYKETGRHEEALQVHKRALAIREKTLGSTHPDFARSLDSLGRLRLSMGDYDAAKVLLERALRIREAALGPDHPHVASGLESLGALYCKLGLFEEARPLYERAIRIFQEQLGPAHQNVAGTLSHLALLLHELGRNEEARPMLERALAIHEKAVGPEHVDVAKVLNNLALVLVTTAQREQAQPLYERAILILEKALGPKHWELATTITNLAILLHSMGLHDQAAPLFERALEIREEVLGPEHPQYANSLLNSATTRVEMGDLEEGRSRLKRALRIYRNALGPDHPRVATTMNLLALLMWETEQYDEALRLGERVLAIRKEVLGSQHCSVAASMHNLALVLQSMEKYEEAAKRSEGCLSILEHCLQRNFIGLQASERLAMARSLRVWVDTSLRLAPHLGDTGYENVLRFKGLVARAGAAERRLLRQGGEEVASRTASLRAAEMRLAQLAQSPPSAFPAEGREERKKAWQEAYAQASAEREALALALTRMFAPLRAGLERLDIDLDDLQAHLGDDEVLVDFLRSGRQYVAWLVRSDGPVERYEIGSTGAIDAAVRRFSQLTSDRETTVSTREWLQAGRALRDVVLAPIREKLDEGIRTLYLSPDAALASVPFAALPCREEGRFLIDDYLVVMLPMAQDLVPWRGESARGSGALAIGDVDYGDAGDVSSPGAAPEFLRLPQTRAEVEFVKSRMGDACTVLMGEEATESRLREAASGKRVLHLATHGLFRDDLSPGLRRRSPAADWMGADQERQLAVSYDPMVLAGLALAGANTRGGGRGDDGILTALETSFLDLDGSELVVLSACGSAAGQVESGEGVLGLVQGFQMAGVRHVIASLWPVDDAATRVLMEHLYDGMLREKAPLSPAAALRAASLAVRGTVGPDGAPLSAPRNWAGFVCFGR